MAVAAMAATPPEKQKRTGFWDQPVIRHAAPGKTYTRFVRGMRIFLPVVAVSVIGIVMAWPRVQNTMAPIKPMFLRSMTWGSPFKECRAFSQ